MAPWIAEPLVAQRWGPWTVLRWRLFSLGRSFSDIVAPTQLLLQHGAPRGRSTAGLGTCISQAKPGLLVCRLDFEWQVLDQSLWKTPVLQNAVLL